MKVGISYGLLFKPVVILFRFLFILTLINILITGLIILAWSAGLILLFIMVCGNLIRLEILILGHTEWEDGLIILLAIIGFTGYL